MKRLSVLAPEFVELVPPELKEGVIYISMIYGSAIHKCCCGCGRKVVTPFSPTDWKLIFDGESVSLHPSIGNWNFPCQSHYWIKRNRVEWAPRWSQEMIETGRTHDRLVKEQYFENKKIPGTDNTVTNAGKSRHKKSENRIWSKLKRWWSQSANQ